MSSRLKHTSPKNGGDRRGGSRPQAHTWVRQIVACDNIVLDRQIVAWAVARGRRHKLVDNLNYFLRCLNSAVLLWDIVGCQINNGGKNGIKIRLHKYRLQQLDQRRSRHSSWFLLDSDGSGNAGRNRKELERNFIPDLIFTKSWTWTLDRGPGAKGHNWMAQKTYWLWNQCWRKIQGQMAASSNQFYFFGCRQPSCLFSKRARAAGIVSTSNPGREIAWGFFVTIIINNRIRPQAHN
jgi:hypothetical protein